MFSHGTVPLVSRSNHTFRTSVTWVGEMAQWVKAHVCAHTPPPPPITTTATTKTIKGGNGTTSIEYFFGNACK